MRTETVLSGAEPSVGAPARHVVRVFRGGDFVETIQGARPVARLRPGDRVLLPEAEAGLRVSWVAMSRAGPSERAVIRVMLGTGQECGEAAGRGAGGLALGGWISRRTGRLVPAGGGTALSDQGRQGH